MASDVTGIERLTDGRVPVEPDAIEDEFARIWQDTSGGDESSIRLRVLNFLGVGLTPAALNRYERVMEALPERHPCRGIMAMTSPGETTVTAAISAHCWRSGSGSRHVCSEEVLLVAAPGQERALASAVLALLVPELSVAMWLVDDVGLDHAIVAELIGAAERVFIDSAGTADPRAVMRSVLHAQQVHEVEICDLAWCRLGSWRGLVAQFFDSGDGARELARLRSIDIVCGGQRPGSEALLMAGWLVSRLGLSLADASPTASGIAATLYDGTRGVSVSVSASGEEGLPLSQVRLRTEGASFLVELHEASGHMHVREEWPDAPVRRTVAQQPCDDASVFTEALDDADDPKIFLASLRSALRLMGEESATGSPGSPS
jgi:hypothetical protein